MKGFWKMTFGIPDDRPLVQVCHDSAPTAGLGDSGDGWEYTGDGSYQRRDMRLSPPPAEEKHLYEEVSVGVWHKREPYG